MVNGFGLMEDFMFRRVSTMPNEERFTRSVFAFILIASSFTGLSRLASLVIGALFLLSVLQGGCILCELYKKLFAKKS